MQRTAAIYARISVNDPFIPKVEDQEARCRALAVENGYRVVDVYPDDGVSAYRSLSDRKGWSELKAAADARAFDVLLFDRQDRLARDQFETLAFIAACGRQGIAWHSVDGGYQDLSDPMQVFIAVFRGGEAESYSKKIAENVSRRNRDDRAKGQMRVAGVRPFGWNRCTETGPNGKVIRRWVEINPEEAALVRAGIDTIRAGGARWDVVKAFNASGLTTTRGSGTWLPSTVYDTLRRGLNAALVEHKGETVGEGSWEPICTPEELQEVRAILAIPVTESSGKPADTLLSGIAQCHCGRVMHAHGTHWARVYRCSIHSSFVKEKVSGHSAIKIELLDNHVINHVAGLFLLMPAAGAVSDADARKLGELYTDLASNSEKLSRLARRDAEGQISAKDFSKLYAEFSAEKLTLESAIAELGRNNARAAMMIESRKTLVVDNKLSLGAAVDVKAELVEKFRSLTLAEQRRLISGAVEIRVNPGHGVKRVELVSALTAPELS